MNQHLTISQNTLLRLLQIAIGWEQSIMLPLTIDWDEVVLMAEQQNVLPIMADGYGIYLINNPGAQSFLSKKENEENKIKILSATCVSENVFLLHSRVLGILSKVFDKAKISYIVMKGMSCGKYYPVPNHRQCGDIDIYPGDAFEESNKALEKAGIHVEPHYYRHTASVIQGVTIENHRILCDLRGPKKQTHSFESLLKTLAQDSVKNGELYGKDYPQAHFPSADFNAHFLPWHVSAHFEFERVTLRHLLDWALFLYHDGNKINVSLLRESKKKFTYGFGPFADILTYLSIRYLNLPVDSLPIEIVEDANSVNKELAEKVLDRMFEATEPASDSNVWRERWKLFKYVWKDGWKYRGLYGMSPIRFMLYKLYGVLFRVGEE